MKTKDFALADLQAPPGGGGMTPLEVLTKARELLSDPDKWIKGAATFNGRYCLVGAVGQSAQSVKDYDSALHLIRTAIYLPTKTLAKWNDAPERTHADILAALDSAITLATAEGEAR